MSFISVRKLYMYETTRIQPIDDSYIHRSNCENRTLLIVSIIPNNNIYIMLV
jgi:hypothetical protein